MNGFGGKVKKWALRALYGSLAAAGLALVNYVVEHGELPEWLSSALVGLLSLLRAEVPFAFGEILGIVLTPSAVLGYLVVMLARKNSVDVDDYNLQNDRLVSTDAAMKRMDRQNKELKFKNAELLASVEALTLLKTELAEQNEGLLKKLDLLAIAADSKRGGIDSNCLSVLQAIATLAENDRRADLGVIDSLVRFGKIQTHAALDVLKESGLISMAGNSRGIRYLLTAQGRAFYLENKGC